MTRTRVPPSQRRTNEFLAKSLVETCVRNSTCLEDLHSGVFPSSATGDYSDVKVVSPYGEIPWNRLGRISDEEMKSLMIEVVDRVFTYLTYLEELTMLSRTARDKWQRPRLDRDLMETVRRERRRAE
jgi:hypothetical protein